MKLMFEQPDGGLFFRQSKALEPITCSCGGLAIPFTPNEDIPKLYFPEGAVMYWCSKYHSQGGCQTHFVAVPSRFDGGNEYFFVNVREVGGVVTRYVKTEIRYEPKARKKV